MVAPGACIVPCRRRTNGRSLKVKSAGHSNFSGPLRTRTVSFRSRLLLFFMIIVIVPMIAVALVLFSITADSETGKADAQIAQGLRAAFAIYDQDRGQARPALARVLRDNVLAGALARGDRKTVAARVPRLAAQLPGVRRIAVYDANRRPIAAA